MGNVRDLAALATHAAVLMVALISPPLYFLKPAAAPTSATTSARPWGAVRRAPADEETAPPWAVCAYAGQGRPKMPQVVRTNAASGGGLRRALQRYSPTCGKARMRR